MNELLADLTVREFELALLEGRYDESAWSVAESRFQTSGPMRHRLLRIQGLGRHLTGLSGAISSLAEARATEAPTDFELALTLLASNQVEPEHSESENWRQRIGEIRTQLGIERFPALAGERSSINAP